MDGDGSVLMNLGTLATLARYRPRNLVHLIFDNGSLLSTGGFATHTTSGLTDLAGVARACGCPNVAQVSSLYEFMEAAAAAFECNDLATIVVRVEAVGPDHYGMDLKLPENAFRFARYVQARQRQPGA
jgi:sulfopyruvate decarboxylase subunit beta